MMLVRVRFLVYDPLNETNCSPFHFMYVPRSKYVNNKIRYPLWTIIMDAVSPSFSALSVRTPVSLHGIKSTKR